MPYIIRNSKLEGTVNDFTTDPVKKLPWSGTASDQSLKHSCTVLDVSTKTVWVANCESENPSLCITDTSATFRLLGLCVNTLMDDIYILKDSGNLTLYGDKQASIRFDERSAQWTALTKDGTLLATIKASKSSLLLGTNNWTIYNDSLECQLHYKGNPYTLPLNLNSCSDEEFNCDDGSCISLAQKCDGVSNCHDSSDEFQCSKLKIKPIHDTYNKKISPPFKNNENFCTVSIELDILDVIEIDEVKGLINIKLNITAEWYDGRVTFSNLNNDTRLNMLEEYESNYLWKPDILFMNIISNMDRKIFGNSKTYIERSKHMPPLTVDDRSALNRARIFSGDHSKIIFFEIARKDYFKTHIFLTLLI